MDTNNTTVKTGRRRRSADERLVEIVAREKELREKLERELAKLDEKRTRLASTPAVRKAKEKTQKAFFNALSRRFSEFDEAAILGALDRFVQGGGNPEDVRASGGDILATDGMPRRGRRPAAA